ncbi:ATPase [Roseivirga ehrenbergii]|uniref:ATPase n=1 Tax=Roseivirga ehrenbergii (strain DSM 102268 / JCM 13514 / KCTC 12282 / NCIMB 14502 / KMM 6017) TaxID=279360 RepID=A0A150X7G0_ROSEK|nr:potassium transporter TrkG [Roseivirga ehrenbergii]KYG74661.1 ATPase [Roseivirga ehrenbergii]
MNFNLKRLDHLAFWISLSGIVVFIADFGYTQSDLSQSIINGYYFVVLGIGLTSTVFRYLEKKNQKKTKVLVFDILSILITITVLYLHLIHGANHQLHPILFNDNLIKSAVILTFIREFSELRLIYKRTILNPAQLFIISFLVIILLGTVLLMLPRATYDGISFIDAFFTSTSAVCVTGLIVVDTGSYFTEFGQIIIICLIQIGGLGILTFASYFSYFFKGGATYENQLALGDMSNSKKLSEVFSTLKYVLIITFGIEMMSATMIYFSLDASTFASQYDQIFFAVFHSISAFCNAGFSTLSNGIYDVDFKFNYFLQIVLISTFFLGALGFPIVVNILNYLKYRLSQVFTFSSRLKNYKPWVLNLNSRINLITTISLTAFGFVLFFILEYNNTMAEHSFFGKIVTALFGAATPRTAGFNSVDMAALSFPTLVITLLLMWIGASPSSTGGGIKTSTFAIAILNILSIARGKTKIEVFRREIADISVRRSYAIISLSLLVIGFGVMVISIFDNDKSLMQIAFECFSAYSTVGLSLGITGDLSSMSKIMLIVIMFVGRVSMLSIMIAILDKVKHKSYRYPTEEITIN